MWQDDLKIYYPNLSKNQKKVADIFLRDEEKAGAMTLKECADKAKVGQATVLRMLEALGYSGWSDFQKSVWMEKGSTDAKRREAKRYETKAESVRIKKYASVYHVIENDIAMIEDMAIGLDISKLEEVVKIIKIR